MAALAAATALLVGCGGRGDDSTVSRTQTTRVEVLQDAPTPQGGPRFDPAGIYRRESPGVVTVISSGLSGAGSGGNAGLGSGFVISGSAARSSRTPTS